MSGKLFKQIQFFQDQSHGAAENMAIDQALLELSDCPILRIYGWSRPAVSLGFAQSHQVVGELSEGVDLVRRWTGGGVVHHGEDLTYSVIVPENCDMQMPNPQESYKLIHLAVCRALDSLEVQGVRLAEEADLVAGSFCFVAPAMYDVMIRDKKISGASQRRGKLGLLHQGSIQHLDIPIGFAQALVESLTEQYVLMEELMPHVQDRVQRLVQYRYQTQRWLIEREDEKYLILKNE
jgi:lipoate-protein ligase A